jgi:rhamnogalacturonan endolyase
LGRFIVEKWRTMRFSLPLILSAMVLIAMNAFLPFLLGTGVLVSTALAQTGAPVAITESDIDYVLANGVITARVLKRNGDLASLRFRGAEMLTDKSGHPGAYWSHDATGGTGLICRITIDPATNNGARAEVSVQGISGGKKMSPEGECHRFRRSSPSLELQ